MGLTPTTETVTTLEDRSWMGPNVVDRGSNRSRTLDGDSVRGQFAAGTFIPSGVVLAEDAATEKAVLYAGTSEEVQTLTEGGAGLTSYTITFNGQTTDPLDDDATPAQVQAALEALSSVGAGNVAVTGTTNPIAMSVKFQGDLANADQPAMTTTPTGGTGTVVVATGTAGGADLGSGGSGTAIGHLDSGQIVPATGDLHVAVFVRGQVIEANLPANSGLDPAAKADLTHIAYF